MEAAVDSKALSSVEIKDADKGHVTAVFSTYDVVDKDGDITVKGAIKDGTQVIISDWNHSSWQGARPIGKGVVRDVGNQAVVEAQFFMNTTHGRDAFEVVKQLGSRQEWSYGFDVTDSDTPDEEAKSAGARRILKAMDVHEVSPVMIGAGIGTRTTGIKADGKPKDEEGDDDKKPKHNHPSDKDCTEKCPAFKKPKEEGKSFSEHAAEVLASVKEFRVRAAEVVAMRTEKGGRVGEESKKLLDGIISELDGFVDLIYPEVADEAQQEWLRSIASDL